MMSDTPAELLAHLDFIYRADGRVLVNGLGLGLVLKGLLLKPAVRHVDVVEIDQDIIKLVWPTYCTDPRAQLHHADAFIIQWPKESRWDFAWHDIWPALCTDNLPEITRLKRKYARKVGWQAAWGQAYIQRMKRNGY
jgi:spermidine synthase